MTHGTVNGYTNYKCRCEPCVLGGRAAQRQARQQAGGRWGTERFPIAPLEERFSLPATALAEQLHADPRNIHPWRKFGIQPLRADTLAITLGLHPSEIWSEWWLVEDETAALVD